MAAYVNTEKCNGCGYCVDLCPMNFIKLINEKAVIKSDCLECGVCVDNCPIQALSLPEK